MNCDRIAPWYQWIERAAFGGKLQRHRLEFLSAADGQQRALVLGDGDGRFVQALAMKHPNLEIDYLDLSAGMVAQAQKRLAGNARVRVRQGDAFQIDFPEATFSLIYLHFFLDCFDTATVSTLVNRLRRWLTPDATLVLTEFSQANHGWRKFYTAAWLRVMYLFFGYATGLQTRSLPEYTYVVAAAGFKLQQQRLSKSGLIVSQLWRL